MKIADFALVEPFNAMRNEMGSAPLLDVFKAPVPRRVLRAVKPALTLEPMVRPRPRIPDVVIPVAPPATPVSAAPVETTPAIFTADVSFDDVQVELDSTLRYRGRRVVFHIYEVTTYQGKYELPKFHITNCTTRQGMRTINKDSRFIATTRQDGMFDLRINGKPVGGKRLAVCQHCLASLNWKGFSRTMSPAAKGRIVREFSLRDYFAEYP